MTIKVRRLKRKRGNEIKPLILTLASIVTLFFVSLIIMPTPSYKECFKTLSDMERYAKKTNENTPMENSDTLRPEFNNYYKSLTPTFFQQLKRKTIWILSKIYLAKPTAWDASAFKTLLEELGNTRQQSGMKDNFVYRIQSQPNAKIVVFGNIQGSFHSLVRNLRKLKELGIIDDTLKITQPQNYIIFMGDVIDRSPFTLETLTAVMRLLQTNPNNVIYLRGNHESNNYWQEHTLKNELQIRAAHLSTSAIPLEMEINRLFNTLPLAAYLSVPSASNDFVRISDARREASSILNESNFADTLIKKTEAGSTYFAVKESVNTSTTKINVRAIIRGEKKRKTFQKNEGLRFLSPDLDSVAWTILSCPNVVYQKALDFYADAFAIITTAEMLQDWEISLYTRDLRTKDPFKETKYNFISGLDLESHKKMASAPSATQAVQQPVAAATTPAQPSTPIVQAAIQPQVQTVAQAPSQVQPTPQQVQAPPQAAPQLPTAPQPQTNVVQQPQVVPQQAITQPTPTAQTQPVVAQDQPVTQPAPQNQAAATQQQAQSPQQTAAPQAPPQAQPQTRLLQIIPENENQNNQASSGTQNIQPNQPINQTQ